MGPSYLQIWFNVVPPDLAQSELPGGLSEASRGSTDLFITSAGFRIAILAHGRAPTELEHFPRIQNVLYGKEVLLISFCKPKVVEVFLLLKLLFWSFQRLQVEAFGMSKKTSRGNLTGCGGIYSQAAWNLWVNFNVFFFLILKLLHFQAASSVLPVTKLLTITTVTDGLKINGVLRVSAVGNTKILKGLWLGLSH